ncbi:PsbP domain-containing protein 7, chloroplastic [Dionaea muscipula]
MALQRCYQLACKPTSFQHQIYFVQSSGDQKQRVQVATARIEKSPAEQFAPLASQFQRRLLVGVGSAFSVAVGANFAGITSSLLGLSPQTGRSLKLDVIYPIAGYSRCVNANLGFEFIYPASWVGDQTLLYRAAKRGEEERSLDPPPLNGSKSSNKRNISEPVVAFGPPGSTGELNISVIVSPVPIDFRIEAYGGPKEVGEAVISTVIGSSRRPDVKADLIDSKLTRDLARNVNYYELEFRVQSPWFHRHNVLVCCAKSGRLYTLNAQAPETEWPSMKQDLYNVAASFYITS